jgi:transposase InsO family protein
LRELALSSGQDTAGISASTLYRFLKQRGLSERQLLAPAAHKKFEAEHSNQIWQSDMLYGPYVQRPSGGKMQALLYAILDDDSRLIPHAQFYASQGLDACLDCLRQAAAARGVPVRLYMDNAKIYRSPQLARISASVGMLIVHTPPYQPEGRGKSCRCWAEIFGRFANYVLTRLGQLAYVMGSESRYSGYSDPRGGRSFTVASANQPIVPITALADYPPIMASDRMVACSGARSAGTGANRIEEQTCRRGALIVRTKCRKIKSQRLHLIRPDSSHRGRSLR